MVSESTIVTATLNHDAYSHLFNLVEARTDYNSFPFRILPLVLLYIYIISSSSLTLSALDFSSGYLHIYGLNFVSDSLRVATQMMNAENDNVVRVNIGGATSVNKQGIVVVGVPVHVKQGSVVVKKPALRDVQNQNIGSARGQVDSISFLGGGPNKDTAVKVCGNKRLTPEPPSGPPFFPTLSNTCANELIVNARRRFELELGGGRIQNNSKHIDSFKSKQSQVESPPKHSVHTLPLPLPLPLPTTSVPRNTTQPLTKPGKQIAQTDSVKVTIDCSDSNALKVTDEKQRADRITRLEKFLKDCDETNSKNYFTMLRHLPPTDLSRHAFELEKRAIHLTIEEGKEVRRMKVLNVLEKPFCSNEHKQTLKLLQAKK